MIDISIVEILSKVKKISRDPDINFPGNGKFKKAKFPGKFPVPISREETVVINHMTTQPAIFRLSLLIIVVSLRSLISLIKPSQSCDINKGGGFL